MTIGVHGDYIFFYGKFFPPDFFSINEYKMFIIKTIVYSVLCSVYVVSGMFCVTLLLVVDVDVSIYGQLLLQ